MNDEPIRLHFTAPDDLVDYAARRPELVLAAGGTIMATPALRDSFVNGLSFKELETGLLLHLRDQIAAELARRTPAAQEIDGWRIDGWTEHPSGLVDLVIARGDRRLEFEKCGFSDETRAKPLEWAVEQARAIDAHAAAALARRPFPQRLTEGSAE